MAEVKLYKKLATYKDKDGEEKTATNFYVACGDQMIPVEVKYFENKVTGSDPNYRGRKMVMSSYAELLPDREDNGKNKEKAENHSTKTAEKAAQGGNGLPF